jgi:hypothetical protein
MKTQKKKNKMIIQLHTEHSLIMHQLGVLSTKKVSCEEMYGITQLEKIGISFFSFNWMLQESNSTVGLFPLGNPEVVRALWFVGKRHTRDE